VHGALDMGLAPGILPGRVGLEAARDWFTTAWGTVPAATGLDCGGVLTAAAEGRIHGLILLGADPVADFPDRQLATRGLAAAGFVVAVDGFLTESSRQADVVLPAAIFAERSGFTTNLEGRVSRLGHKVSAPGVAWPDWMIAAELATRLGADLGFVDLPGIWAEIERLAPSHEGLTLERLGSRHAADGLLAPLHATPSPHAGTGRPGGGEEATGAVASDTGSGSTQAVPAPIDPSADPGIGAVETQGVPVMAADPTPPSAVAPPPRPDGPPPAPLGPPAPRRVEFPPLDAYSLRLVSGRTLWDTGIAVTRSPSLAHLPRPLALRVNPYDLDRLGVAGGEQVRMHAPNRTSVVDVVADRGVPRGSAALAFNTSDGGAGDFIDATAAVTDVRLEHL
jgi:NADH-quinone oxidoreductase subunit G